MFLIILVLAISVGCSYLIFKFGDDMLPAFIIAVIGWIVFIIMAIAALCNNIGANGNIAANKQLYNSLVYQLENNLYDNDNDIGKKELYNQITKWNTDLARGKEMQRNFWIGIFYPNIYDNFEFIELVE